MSSGEKQGKETKQISIKEKKICKIDSNEGKDNAKQTKFKQVGKK